MVSEAIALLSLSVLFCRMGIFLFTLEVCGDLVDDGSQLTPAKKEMMAGNDGLRINSLPAVELRT